MGVFATPDDPATAGHEQVVFCQDRRSGLQGDHRHLLHRARSRPRRHPLLPVRDRGRRPRATCWTSPAAWRTRTRMAGLDLGGGKAVIWGDPEQDKSEALLRAYGRFVESLGGRYYTACDVGTYVPDMDLVARETRYVTGRSVEHGGAGDSSILTAWGVFQGMRAAAEHAWGTPTPGRPPRRRRRAGQGRPLPGRAPARRRRLGGRDRRQREGAGLGPAQPPADRPGRGRHRADHLRHRRLRPLRPRRRPQRRHRAGAARQDRRRCGEQPARPPRHREAPRPSAASSTRRTTWSTPAGSSRSPTRSRASTSTAPSCGRPGSSTPPGRSCSCADAEGVPPAVGRGPARGAADGRGRPAAHHPRRLNAGSGSAGRARVRPSGRGSVPVRLFGLSAVDRGYRRVSSEPFRRSRVARCVTAARSSAPYRVDSVPAGPLRRGGPVGGNPRCRRRALAMYRKSHERCLTSSGPAFGLPRILCEGVEPWGAAVLRPSRQRWPGS